MLKHQKLAWAFLLVFLCLGCQNANVTVTGLSSGSSSRVSASGANPINAASYGAAVGTTSGGYVMKMKVSSQQINPTSTTSGGYTISAKAVKW